MEAVVLMWRTLLLLAVIMVVVFGAVALAIWRDPRRRRTR